MNYIPKSDNYTVEFLESELGTNVKTYIKNGYYKEFSESSFMSIQLFRYDENRIYFKHQIQSDTLIYLSTISKEEPPFEYEIYPKSEMVLGILCDKLVITEKDVTKTFYYSAKYSLNSEYYKNFTYSNKNEILKIMKAVYLKLVMEYNPFIVEIVGTRIKREKLSEEVFELPKHSVLIAQ